MCKWIVLFFSVCVSYTADARDLDPSDLTYLGRWSLPAGAQGTSRWGYGGKALAYDAGSDSLWGSGHVYQNHVGRVSIPDVGAAATQLAPFRDVRGDLAGLPQFADPPERPRGLRRLAGLCVLGADVWSSWQDTYAIGSWDRLNVPTLIRSRVGPSGFGAAGLFKAGPYDSTWAHAKRLGGYLCTIPAAWAEEHTPGHRLATGRGWGAGNAGVSRGPSLAAVDVRDSDPGTPLPAISLVDYPARPEPVRSDFPAWSPCDQWNGAEWVDWGGVEAVVFAGRRGRGEVFYGNYQEAPNGCNGGRGYHCDSYSAELVLYAPSELAEVAQGNREPSSLRPYAVVDITEELADTCHYRVGGMAFDTKRGRLYLVQENGESPIVHAWRIEPIEPEPPPDAGERAVVAVRIGTDTERAFEGDDEAAAIIDAVRYLIDQLERANNPD